VIDIVKLFVSQYFLILLMSLQSRYVMLNNYKVAPFISVLLGICGWYTQGVVAEAFKNQSVSLFFTFVIASPFGVISGMLLHDYFESKGK
jgi:hypothetical protein